MYRILSCSKDAYITNKLINGSASLSSNTGQAGTLDLYKLYNEGILPNGSSSGIEITRGLIQFDLTQIYQLTSSILNINDPSFHCYLSMKDQYSGQTVPSNYTLSIFPLALNWDEGRGSDVLVYADLDTANFLSASSNPAQAWFLSGCAAGGGLGGSNLDYYISGNLGNGVVTLECTQSFQRGDEDLLIYVTKLVSGTLAGLIPNNGFRLAFTSSQETDQVTRFVKRFATRDVVDVSLQPKLIVQYKDAIIDDNQMLYFDTTNTLYFYNSFRGTNTNFLSNSNQVTGSNCVILTLVSSESVSYTTSSYSTDFSASITYTTSSLFYLTQAFTGSQLQIGQNLQTGIYYASVSLSSSNAFFNPPSGSFPVGFSQFWKSLDGTVTYATGNFLQINKINGGNNNVNERNFVVNVTNLKNYYSITEVARLRVFVQNYNTEEVAYGVPQIAKPSVFKEMHFRLLNAFTRDIIIPFDFINNSTLLSSDGYGMYFDLWASDLDLNTVYELEFIIVENGRDYLINNEGFRFKVIP